MLFVLDEHRLIRLPWLPNAARRRQSWPILGLEAWSWLGTRLLLLLPLMRLFRGLADVTPFRVASERLSVGSFARWDELGIQAIWRGAVFGQMAQSAAGRADAVRKVILDLAEPAWMDHGLVRCSTCRAVARFDAVL